MDLAKRETPLRSQPQTTFRQDTTMPRQATDLPGLEVNAAIHRPDTSAADELSRLLGLANNVGQKIAGDVQDNADQQDAASALLDFQTGNKNDQRFAKSRAYRDAWQLQGAKKLAVDVSTEVTEKFNTALNDPDHPATIDDLDALFENTIKAHLLDEHGKPLNFITPQAKMALGTALSQLKADLMPKAAEAIKAQQDTKLFATTFHNMLFEHETGAEIGAPRVEAKPQAIEPYYKPPIPKGWKGNVEDAIQELGMTPTEAQTFIKTGKDTRKAPAPVSMGGAVIEPFPGFSRMKPTSVMGAAREGGSKHNGEDFAVPSGTELKAPMQGTVIAAFKNDRGGNQVRVQQADGTIIGFAHLSEIGVHKGQAVQAGELLGLSGNTGHTTGPHVHVTLEKDGQKVSVREYFKTASAPASGSGVVIADGSEPQLQAAQAAPSTLRPGFNVEGFMASLPPSVDKGQAKTWLIDNLIAEAASKGDASLLNGLEDSVRKDGSPSFTPTERLKLSETRDRIEEHARVDADRQEQKLQQDNADLVLQAFVDGKPPSSSWLSEQAHKGLLSSNFVYSMVNHTEEQAKQDAREARMEARQATSEADSDLDAVVYGMVAQRRAGDLSGASYADDQRRFQNGELGTGKKAAARLLQLQAATKSGQSILEQNPEFAYYSSALKTNFKPRKGVQDGQLLILKPQANVSEAVYQAMAAWFQEKVHSGASPSEAYHDAVAKFVQKQPQGANNKLASVRQQIADLRRKRAGQ